MNYEQCEYFECNDIDKNNAVFDHPTYECFCNKSGTKRPLILPDVTCKRCIENQQNTQLFISEEKKSLTWIALDDKQWLLICIGPIKPLSLQAEIKLQHEHNIGTQQESGDISTSTYTWRSYRIWKMNNSLLTEHDKRVFEQTLNENISNNEIKR